MLPGRRRHAAADSTTRPRAEYWTARELTPPQTSRTAHNLQAVARLADGVPLGAAQAEISALSRALKARYGDATWMSDATAVSACASSSPRRRGRPLLMLFGAAVLLLVIACLNVRTCCSRASPTRRRELALRLAIGAGQWRIARQLLAEALVLCTAGGVAGIAIALRRRARARGAAAGQPAAHRQRRRSIGPALGFALGGVARRGDRTDAGRDAQRRGDRQLSARRSPKRSAHGRRHAPASACAKCWCVAQVALTIVLLIGAGLLDPQLHAACSPSIPVTAPSDALMLDLTAPFSRDLERRAAAGRRCSDELLAAARGAAGRARRRPRQRLPARRPAASPTASSSR